jgi:hypothetical protein
VYFGVQTYYTLKVSHAAFLLKSCKVVLILGKREKRSVSAGRFSVTAVICV